MLHPERPRCELIICREPLRVENLNDRCPRRRLHPQQIRQRVPVYAHQDRRPRRKLHLVRPRERVHTHDIDFVPVPLPQLLKLFDELLVVGLTKHAPSPVLPGDVSDDILLVLLVLGLLSVRPTYDRGRDACIFEY